MPSIGEHSYVPSIFTQLRISEGEPWAPARAGDTINAARKRSAAASNADRRNCRRDVMCEMPLCISLKRLRADSARAGVFPRLVFVMAGHSRPKDGVEATVGRGAEHRLARAVI
jgi:hypothetical protein